LFVCAQELELQLVDLNKEINETKSKVCKLVYISSHVCLGIGMSNVIILTNM